MRTHWHSFIQKDKDSLPRYSGIRHLQFPDFFYLSIWPGTDARHDLASATKRYVTIGCHSALR